MARWQEKVTHEQPLMRMRDLIFFYVLRFLSRYIILALKKTTVSINVNDVITTIMIVQGISGHPVA